MATVDKFHDYTIPFKITIIVSLIGTISIDSYVYSNLGSYPRYWNIISNEATINLLIPAVKKKRMVKMNTVSYIFL